MLETLSREIRSGCPEELLYAKKKLEAWKGVRSLKKLRVNVKRVKCIISSEKAK